MTEARRASYRKQPTHFLEIFARDTGKFVGRVVDCTNSGLKLQTDNPPEVGVTYQWKFALQEPIDGHTEICFDATCRWCSECTGRLLAGSFVAGVEFTRISATDSALIESLLESSWFHDWRQLPDYDAVRREAGILPG